LIFEMITGDGPFHEATESAAQMLAHVNRPAPSLSQLAIVPKELAAVVARSLSKDPAKRPPSAREMALQLEASLGTPPPRTPRPPLASSPVAQPVVETGPASSSGAPGATRPRARPSLREKLFAETDPARQELSPAVQPVTEKPGRGTRTRALVVGLALAGATGFALFQLEDRSEPVAAPPAPPVVPPTSSHEATSPAPAPPASVSAPSAPASSSAPARPAPSTADPAARPAKSPALPARGPLPRVRTDTLPGSGL
jgi:serine/threonine protein kinase